MKKPPVYFGCDNTLGGVLKNSMSYISIAEKSAALGGFSRCDVCEWIVFQHCPMTLYRRFDSLSSGWYIFST